MEDSSFRTTRWSMVLGATAPAAQSRAALEQLCSTYWYPSYAFVRRQGRSHEEAQDLVQGFFTRLVEKPDWRVAPERGRFRAFLLAALRNFMANELQREQAAKRGGGARIVSIDDEAGRRYALECVDDLTPEKLYERNFALQLLDETLAELRAEQERAGKLAQFEALKGFLSGGADEAPYERVAAELGLSAGAARVAVHRLRKRFGELARSAVADVVREPGEVEAELQALLDALAD